MSDGGLGLGSGWASARGGRQGEDGVGEKTHSRGGGAGDTGRASEEQGPRHDTRRGFARRVGRMRETSKSGTTQVQFSETVCFGVTGRARLCLRKAAGPGRSCRGGGR